MSNCMFILLFGGIIAIAIIVYYVNIPDLDLDDEEWWNKNSPLTEGKVRANIKRYSPSSEKPVMPPLPIRK